MADQPAKKPLLMMMIGRRLATDAGEELTPDELSDVVSYLLSLKGR